jgi:hypothetical protein
MNQPRDLPGLDEVKQLLAAERVEGDGHDEAFVFLVEGRRSPLARTQRRRSILKRIARKIGSL